MEAKKYYWLKLKEDFFDDDTIAWIEDQEDGMLYSNFYLKLCLKSIKTQGILIRNVGDVKIPYDIKKLAEITRVSVDIAAAAMDLFKKIGLVKILQKGEIYITKLESMIGSETTKASLMRKKREREKILSKGEGNIVTDMLPECYTDIEIEKEKEIDNKDIDKDNNDIEDDEPMDDECSSILKEKPSKTAGFISHVVNSKDLIKCDVLKYFEKCGFMITSRLIDFVKGDVEVFGAKWMKEAADICVKRGKINNYKYLIGILQNWQTKGKKLFSNMKCKAELSSSICGAYRPLTSIFEED